MHLLHTAILTLRRTSTASTRDQNSITSLAVELTGLLCAGTSDLMGGKVMVGAVQTLRGGPLFTRLPRPAAARGGNAFTLILIYLRSTQANNTTKVSLIKKIIG